MTALPRAVRALIAAAALVAGLVTVTTAATSEDAYAIDTSKGTAGFCPDADGVTVIVDFQELGGATIVRCAPGDQATGHAALKNAGFEITGTNRWGEAFICRIEAKPGAADEPCIDTPPASAYWSYWHAPNGGSWTYSQWGAMNRKPPPGSFEGWSFSKDKTETTNPPPRVAPTRPAPPPDESDDGDDSARPGSPDDDASPDRPKKSDDDEDPETESAASDEPTPGPSDTPTEAADWTGGDELTSTSATTDGSIPAGTLAGIGAIAALSTIAGVTAWRRRPGRTDST